MTGESATSRSPPIQCMTGSGPRAAATPGDKGGGACKPMTGLCQRISADELSKLLQVPGTGIAPKEEDHDDPDHAAHWMTAFIRLLWDVAAWSLARERRSWTRRDRLRKTGCSRFTSKQ